MKDIFQNDCGDTWKFNGIIDESVAFISDIQLLRTDLWSRFVQQFKEEDADYEAGWRGEYWGKMMRGACLVYAYSKDDRLYQTLTETIEDMLTAQDELGRISSYAVSHEFEGWDLWGRKYVLLGMQYFCEICKDKELSEIVIDSMCSQADYILSKIGHPEEGKIHITKATSHWRGLNSSSILEPIVKLYNLTGQQKYLDFASYIVNAGGTDVVNIFDLAYQNQLYPYQYPVTKAYEMTSCFEGLLEYYKVTGEKKYRTAIINYANKILESDFTIIGSSGCTHELFDHSTMQQSNPMMGKIMQETCVTVTLMKFFYSLNKLTGESKYADAFEISLYNAYLGAINTEQIIDQKILKDYPDWCAEPLPFDSYSPLTAGTRGNGIGGLKLMSDNHYYGCCACIGSAGLGMAPKLSLLHGENTLLLNLYVDGCIQTKTPSGKKLVISTKTKYPAEGKIQITLSLEKPEEFEFLFRIPYWSKKYEITIQDSKEKINYKDSDVVLNKGYLGIKRYWKNGDSIEVLLDMRTEILTSVISTMFALRRGPIMLAQENRLGYSVDEPMSMPKEKDGYAEVEFPEIEIAPYKHQIEVEVTLNNSRKVHLTDYASAGKLWSEESKMAVWMLFENSDC